MEYLMVTKNPKMAEVFTLARKVAKSSSTVLILGESGTGKEVLAKYIHHLSQRKGPFLAINCAAIPEELLEAELFGYEKGAFTGATKTKPGKFELAHQGTIFLDEIGDLSLKLQAKLLRVIQEKTIERLGGEKPIKVATRIIAATNQDLEKMVQERRFREDLFYRLNVFPIYIPPLRERREDIPDLCEFFLKMVCKREDIPKKKLNPEVLALFLEYDFPGNVRELENMIERLVILSEGEEITLQDLPHPLLDKIQSSKPKKNIIISKKVTLPQPEEKIVEERFFLTAPLPLNDPFSPDFNLNEYLREMEIFYLKKALELAQGVKSKAAKLLGLNRTTFLEKLKRYGLIDQNMA